MPPSWNLILSVFDRNYIERWLTRGSGHAFGEDRTWPNSDIIIEVGSQIACFFPTSPKKYRGAVSNTFAMFSVRKAISRAFLALSMAYDLVELYVYCLLVFAWLFAVFFGFSAPCGSSNSSVHHHISRDSL